jgi:diguanylate cyclase (GGDEF)-like protein
LLLGGSAEKQGMSVDGAKFNRQRLLWVAAAALMAAIGSAGAVALAAVQSGHHTDTMRQALTHSSMDVAASLKLALQRDQDLLVSAAAFVAGGEKVTNAEFHRWFASIGGMGHYPEIEAMGRAVVVPASRLAAFGAAAVREPAGLPVAGGSFRVTPQGQRSFYCFSAGAVARTAGNAVPTGFDLCGGDGTLARSIRAARDLGVSAYVPVRTGTATLLVIQTPLYRDGLTPSTTAKRRAGFAGLVGLAVDPAVMLDRALDGRVATAVTFRYHAGSSDMSFRWGRASAGAESAMIDLQNGWTVQTFVAMPETGILAHEGPRSLLLAGFGLSLLLGLLVYVLGTGRMRAMRLVSVKTGELLYQALHDSLTGLPNRGLIMDRIDQLLVRNRRLDTTGAVLYVDLDEFKNVNDSLGHAAGDQLLVAVATRLQSALRKADTIGRMGGDEFVVLIDGASFEVAPELVAERLLAVMRQPFELDGTAMPLLVNATIGIAIGDRATAGELLRDADVALYGAKAAGKNRFAVFHPEMQTEISRRIELEFALRSAVEDGQFSLVYQPIYDLSDLTILGMEALLRWKHPVQGSVGPDEFVPILEQTGQITEVGGWVLTTACEQMAAWHDRGDTLDLSVNVSGRQLDDDAIVGQIRDALRVSGLPATSLIIEVTETALMRDAAATAQRLRAIKDLGVRIAIDDFGTGYSSLAYLQQFSVDCLKIDQSFTSAITASPESRALIGTLVQLGRDLGLATLAEGVETVEQMDYLRAQHVQEAQGFLLSRPLDPDTLERQLLAPARPVTTERPSHDYR